MTAFKRNKKKSLAALLVDDFDQLNVEANVHHAVEASVPNLRHLLDTARIVASEFFVDLGTLFPCDLNEMIVSVNLARVIGFSVDDVFHFFFISLRSFCLNYKR